MKNGEVIVREGENIYTTPNPEGGPNDYVCVNCDFNGTKREVLEHKCGPSTFNRVYKGI